VPQAKYTPVMAQAGGEATWVVPSDITMRRWMHCFQKTTMYPASAGFGMPRFTAKKSMESEIGREVASGSPVPTGCTEFSLKAKGHNRRRMPLSGNK
jgi:hypothetical protein